MVTVDKNRHTGRTNRMLLKILSELDPREEKNILIVGATQGSCDEMHRRLLDIAESVKLPFTARIQNQVWFGNTSITFERVESKDRFGRDSRYTKWYWDHTVGP